MKYTALGEDGEITHTQADNSEQSSLARNDPADISKLVKVLTREFISDLLRR